MNKILKARHPRITRLNLNELSISGDAFYVAVLCNVNQPVTLKVK